VEVCTGGQKKKVGKKWKKDEKRVIGRETRCWQGGLSTIRQRKGSLWSWEEKRKDIKQDHALAGGKGQEPKKKGDKITTMAKAQGWV